MPITIFSGETKYVPFRVKGVDPSTQDPINPTTATLQAGFVPSSGGDDPPTTWYSATWDSTTPDSTGSFWGLVLVGPNGGASLARGTWTVWAKFTLGSETIQEPVPDTVTIS